MRSLTLPLLLAGSSLLAQSTTLNGGLQAGLNFPTGDFADKKTSYGDYLGANGGLGVHFGGHLDFNFTQNHQLRLILNANGFASKEQTIFGNTQQNTFSVAQLGADYVFNMTSPTHGGYFLAGLNVNKVKAT